MVAQTHQCIGSIKLISEVYNYSGYFSCLEGNKEEHFLFFLSRCLLQKHIFFCLEQLCITLTASLQGFQATFPPVSANQAGKLLNKTFSGINLQNCLLEWEESFCYVSVFKLFFSFITLSFGNEVAKCDKHYTGFYRTPVVLMWQYKHVPATLYTWLGTKPTDAHLSWISKYLVCFQAKTYFYKYFCKLFCLSVCFKV